MQNENGLTLSKMKFHAWLYLMYKIEVPICACYIWLVSMTSIWQRVLIFQLFPEKPKKGKRKLAGSSEAGPSKKRWQVSLLLQKFNLTVKNTEGLDKLPCDASYGDHLCKDSVNEVFKALEQVPVSIDGWIGCGCWHQMLCMDQEVSSMELYVVHWNFRMAKRWLVLADGLPFCYSNCL